MNTEAKKIIVMLQAILEFRWNLQEIITSLRKADLVLAPKERIVLSRIIDELQKAAIGQEGLDESKREEYLSLLQKRIKYVIKEKQQLLDFVVFLKQYSVKLRLVQEEMKILFVSFDSGTSLVWKAGKSEFNNLIDKYENINYILKNLDDVANYFQVWLDKEVNFFMDQYQQIKVSKLKINQKIEKIKFLIEKKKKSNEEIKFLSNRKALLAYLNEINLLSTLVDSLLNPILGQLIEYVKNKTKEREFFITDLILDYQEIKHEKRGTFRKLWDQVKFKSFLNPNRLNVLMLGIPFSIKSGVTRAIINLSNHLMEKGTNVVIMNHWWHKYYYWKKSSDIKLGTKMEKVPVNISPYSLSFANIPSGEERYLGRDWAAKLAIRKKLLEKYKFIPDVVHVHTHTFEYDEATKILLEIAGNPPLIYTLHQFIPYVKIHWKDKLRLLNGELNPEQLTEIRRKGYLGREKAQETLMQKADAIVTIADSHKMALDILYPEFKNKTYSIPNGTDFMEYAKDHQVINEAALLKKKYSPHGEKIIIYVGRLEGQKDISVVLDAFVEIVKQHPEIKLVLVGPAEKDRVKLIKWGLSKEVIEKIDFTGWIKGKNALAAHYKMADILIQPLYTPELYALVVLEAVGMGTPTISCPGKLTFGDCYSKENILKTVDFIFANSKVVQIEMKKKMSVLNGDYSLESYVKKHLELYKSLMKLKVSGIKKIPVPTVSRTTFISIKSLADEIDEIIKPYLQSDEFYSVCIKDLTDGAIEVAIDKDKSLIMASMVKPYFGLAFLHAAKVDHKFNFGPNSLRHLKSMISESNNISTRWVVQQIGAILKNDSNKGPEAIQEILDKNYSFILPNIQIVENVPLSGKTYLNKASVWNHISFLTYLWQNKDKNLICNELFSLMGIEGTNRSTFDRFKIGTSIPFETPLYEKTGSNAMCIGEYGILIPKGISGKEFPYAIAIVINSKSRKIRYTNWRKSRENIIRKVSDHVYQHIMKKHNQKIQQAA